jgi:hypothetical protein
VWAARARARAARARARRRAAARARAWRQQPSAKYETWALTMGEIEASERVPERAGRAMPRQILSKFTLTHHAGRRLSKVVGRWKKVARLIAGARRRALHKIPRVLERRSRPAPERARSPCATPAPNSSPRRRRGPHPARRRLGDGQAQGARRGEA